MVGISALIARRFRSLIFDEATGGLLLLFATATAADRVVLLLFATAAGILPLFATGGGVLAALWATGGVLGVVGMREFFRN